MLGAYDHANAGFIGNIGIEKVVQPTNRHATEKQKVAELKACDPVICHVVDPAWEELLKQKTSGLIVRVTTDGFRPIEEARSPQQDIKGRYILHLSPPAHKVEPAEWELILETLAIPANREKLASGGDPEGIRRFFADEILDLLPALAILCQGYLAVHAKSQDNPDVEATCRKALGLEEFSLAEPLNFAHWSKWTERQADWNPPEGAPEDYWQCLRDEDEGAGLIQKTKREWSCGKLEAEADWSPVQSLLEQITDARTIIEPDAVATAYVQLAKKLGGVRGS